ncbi:hypothetical protein HHK36_002968 [Tetracentron sinense]|uniref:Amidase domain-containing protein n=1 Tax=Tetracentron sinense TaxID=13715 RepID=A0A834ZMZ1_TETSI|nr:hypothetical protein HHK36_002968 [Tetracentron sinense]
MENLYSHKPSIFLCLLLLFSSSLLLAQALTPAGTIQRTTRQQVLASLPPSHETTSISGSSQMFLTSPSGKYGVFLLRRETSFGAGGFGNDFCYIQVQESGQSVWESECASVSNVNTCSLVFSDVGLEIFDGSRSAWDTDADGERLHTLVLLDIGDMQIRDQEGELIWKASDNPIANQNCGSIGAPGLSPAHPPFASPISRGISPFGQSLDNQGQQSQLGFQQQQQQQQLGYPQQTLNQPLSGLNQPFSSLNQPFGANNQQSFVDNTPFDSGSSREKPFQVGVAFVSLFSFLACFGFLLATMAVYYPLRPPLFLSSLLLILTLSGFSAIVTSDGFSIKEATVHDLQVAFKQNKLTSRELVEFYIREIHNLNPLVRGVIEVNPDALHQADIADRERSARAPGSESGLHGIPILLKDNIATKDKLNTTAGSFALLGSVVPRDAGVVTKLRKAGAIVLGKASLSEWAHFRSNDAPSGWNARAGQGKNPYVLSADPCGSSSGSAISVAANMVAVSLGTETDGSIICPSNYNSVVGIKPTVGLTSRAGVIPISPRQDTVGPMCRTVSDAVYVLDAIVGFDRRDAATRKASKFIPNGGYKQFLKADGLKGKRLGIVRNPFTFPKEYQYHLNKLRQRGAILVDHLEIANIDVIFSNTSGEDTALVAEFKLSLNAYLKELITSPVRSLADIIAFNKKFSDLEMINKFGQKLFLEAESTNGIGNVEKKALLNMARLTRDGFEKLMMENKLDALVTPGAGVTPVLAIGGFPGISIPAGYDRNGVPFGICFGGLRGSEPKLIEITYALEQATKIRKPPSFRP